MLKRIATNKSHSSMKKYINLKGETIVAHFIGDNVQYGVEGKKTFLLKSKERFLEISKDWNELS